MDVKTGCNQTKPPHCESRKNFYDWLATEIDINGVVSVERDTEFDDHKYRSGGIRLHYESVTGQVKELKEGILLEAGFDDVPPNKPVNISSWAYNHAAEVDVVIEDNRTLNVACYHPGYTLVEKLQTLSTKYRKQRETGAFPRNFMRHYYDIYCLLRHPDVEVFIDTPEYMKHKEKRFRSGDNPVISENEALLLSNPDIKVEYEKAYDETVSLYYKGQPTFDEIMARIKQHVDHL